VVQRHDVEVLVAWAEPAKDVPWGMGSATSIQVSEANVIDVHSSVVVSGKKSEAAAR
jgi:hypothetical protein